MYIYIYLYIKLYIIKPLDYGPPKSGHSQSVLNSYSSPILCPARSDHWPHSWVIKGHTLSYLMISLTSYMGNIRSYSDQLNSISDLIPGQYQVILWLAGWDLWPHTWVISGHTLSNWIRPLTSHLGNIRS